MGVLVGVDVSVSVPVGVGVGVGPVGVRVGVWGVPVTVIVLVGVSVGIFVDVNNWSPKSTYTTEPLYKIALIKSGDVDFEPEGLTSVTV